MTKALVTGGAGFIGSYLIEHLINNGYQCVVIDNLYQNSYNNIIKFENQITFYQEDITNELKISEIFDKEKPDFVFHLAAHHYIPFCNTNPKDAILTNIAGTQNVADACANYNVKKVYFASTAAVYAPSLTPHSETSLVDPIDIYGVTKIAGEKIMRFLHDKTGINVFIGRFFNAIGKRETNPHIIPEILKQLSECGDSPLKLKLGNLFPKRDYIHASDMASAVLSLIESSEKFDVVNIGMGISYSVKDLVEMFEKTLGKKIEIIEDSSRLRKSDRPELCSNNSKLKSHYLWSPKYSLQQTIDSLF